MAAAAGSPLHLARSPHPALLVLRSLGAFHRICPPLPPSRIGLFFHSRERHALCEGDSCTGRCCLRRLLCLRFALWLWFGWYVEVADWVIVRREQDCGLRQAGGTG